MRLLKHRIVNKVLANSESTWEKIDPNGKIYLNASSSFIRYMSTRHTLMNIYDEVNNKSFYIINGGSCIIVPGENKELSLMDIEGCSVASVYFTRKDLVKTGGIIGCRMVYEKYMSLKKHDLIIKNAKTNYISTLIEKKEKEGLLNVAIKQLKSFEKYNIENGILKIEFENVVAEDTEAKGEDIELGTLTFNVHVYDNEVYLVDGSESRYTDYNEEAFHPHHMEDGGICLGTQEPDFHTAVTNMEFSIVEAILYKFAHSYTSDDDAGSNWVKWVEGYEEKEQVWVEYLGENADRDDCVFSDVTNEYILEQDAIYLDYRSDWAHSDDTYYSDFHDHYIAEQDAVYSEELSTYILDEESVELQQGRGYVPNNYEYMVDIDDDYYHLDDVTEPYGHSELHPISDCHYSSALDSYILKDEAIPYNDDYYTADTLPEEDEDEEDENVF